MKIALLEYSAEQKSATGVRGRAMQSYLENSGHHVEVLAPDAAALERFERQRYGLAARLKRRLLRRQTLPHHWDFLADQLEPQIRRGHFDAVIGRGQDMAYVLTRSFDCLKILDMANILFLEAYYVWGPNLTEVEETFAKEMSIFNSVDYIFCHHELLTQFFIRQFDTDGKFSAKAITARMGCERSSLQAQYSPRPRMVYAGSYYYIQDPYLLASLAKISPYPIDCFGPANPNRLFLPTLLNYKGYAQGLDFLADYQFGLITVSRDLLRQHSPSTKFAYYFACGLPVLFPEWMKEGYTYPDCAMAYNEENFIEQVYAAAAPATWHRMNEAARETAHQLSWEKVLQPVGDLLGKVRRAAEHDNDLPR
ncbi:MAG: hypothetical protein HY231_05370 [Acidobacteria bacterium]|nr:hypothetical protein [Acidobacteriota bacterium]